MKVDDLNQKITNQVIAMIENKETGSWSVPWRSLGAGVPRSMSSGKPYRGVNWIILTVEQADRGFKSNRWGTYRQWWSKGTEYVDDEGKTRSTVHVTEGEKATAVFLWKKEKPSKRMLAKDPDAKPYLLARTFYVFNRDQVTGLQPESSTPDRLTEHERWDEADGYFRAIGADITEDGDRAYYAPVADRIAVPKLAQFPNRDHFYTTMAHEHVHWTGHASRLNRDLHNRFGSEAYAMEELVAELGAAFWGGQFGMEGAVRTDHAAYLASWLRVLKADPKALLTSASKAQAALDHLNQLAGYSASNEAEADAVTELAVA